MHARDPARPQHAAHPPSHTGVLTTRAALTLSSPKATNRPQPRNRSEWQNDVRNFDRISRRTTDDNPGWRKQKRAKQDAAAQSVHPPAFRSEEGNDDMPINRPAQNPFVTPRAVEVAVQERAFQVQLGEMTGDEAFRALEDFMVSSY